MKKLTKPANTIRFDEDVEKIVNSFNVHGNINKTVNQLIRRAASVESEDDKVERILQLVIRQFALTYTVNEAALENDDFAAKVARKRVALQNEVS